MSRSVVIIIRSQLKVDTCNLRSTQRAIFSVVGEPRLYALLVEEMLVRVTGKPDDSHSRDIIFAADQTLLEIAAEVRTVPFLRVLGQVRFYVVSLVVN